MPPTNTPSLAALLLLVACATPSPGTAPNRFPQSALTSMPDAAATPAPTVAPEPAMAPGMAPAMASFAATTELRDFGTGRGEDFAGQPQDGRGRPRWRDGGALMQGYFGATVYNNVERSSGGVSVSADDLEIPAIGGGGQWKFAGDKIDLGFEGLIGFNWRSSSTAFATGGGGAVVAVDVDLFLLDFYGGPFASVFLGDALRLYAGAGPLMQWAFYDERSNFSNDDGSGFGLGYYARTGAELHLGRGSLVGAGVRWSDSEIDLGGALGDVNIDGFLFMITYSYFY